MHLLCKSRSNPHPQLCLVLCMTWTAKFEIPTHLCFCETDHWLALSSVLHKSEEFRLPLQGAWCRQGTQWKAAAVCYQPEPHSTKERRNFTVVNCWLTGLGVRMLLAWRYVSLGVALLYISFLSLCMYIYRYVVQVIILCDSFLWQCYWSVAWIIPVILCLTVTFQYCPSPVPEGVIQLYYHVFFDCTVVITKLEQQWIQAIILLLHCTESGEVDVLLWILCLTNTQGFGEVYLLSTASHLEGWPKSSTDFLVQLCSMLDNQTQLWYAALLVQIPKLNLHSNNVTVLQGTENRLFLGLHSVL